MKRIWELIAALVILGAILKAAIALIEPLVPYMLLALLFVLIWAGYWAKSRRW